MSQKQKHWWGAVLLMLSVAGLYFSNLSAGSLRIWDESLTAERSREILVTGDWLSPHSALKPDFHKPPLYYWLTAILFRCFGESELTVRFWSALFGLGCMAMLLSMGARSQSCWTGAWAVFLLATTAPWMNYTRKGMLDSSLVLSMLGIIHTMRWGPPTSRWFRAGLWLAFGCMVKNPLPAIAFLVPLIDAPTREDRRLVLRNTGQALLLGLALGLPWYGLQALRWGSPFVERFFIINIVQRTTTTLGPLQGGPLFYFQKWWNDAPLTLFLFAGALAFGLLFARDAVRRLRGYAAMALTTLIMLTLVSTKRDTYLLLVYPFAVLFSAGMIATFASRPIAMWVRSSALLALIASSFVIFVPRLRVVPDYACDIKDIAVQLRARAHQGERIVTLEQTAGALMFYSYVIAIHAAGAPLEEFAPSLPGETPFLVLLRHEQRRRMDWARIEAATRRAPPDEVCRNNIYVIMRFPAARAD